MGLWDALLFGYGAYQLSKRKWDDDDDSSCEEERERRVMEARLGRIADKILELHRIYGSGSEFKRRLVPIKHQFDAIDPSVLGDVALRRYEKLEQGFMDEDIY